MEQLVAFVGPFVVGLLVGVLAKRVLSEALILIALFIALAALGYTLPEQVTGLLQQLGYAAEDALDRAMKIKDAVPYSSVAFLIGLAIGLWKG
jgi:MFS-type transporter involved in bile tolerance (Atg22 family)